MKIKFYSHKHTCKQCGKEFRGRPDRKFCSPSCASQDRIPWNKDNHDERPEKKNGKTKKCSVCGKKYYISKYRADTSKFCSRECYFESRWPDNKEQRICVICDASFEVMKSQKKQTCSNDCYSIFRSKLHEGDRSPRWKGGYDQYYGPNWKRQRRRARKRAGYVCQNCGITENKLGRQLDVHHIIRIGDFEDKRKANHLSNLIAYCHPCHMKAENGQL